MSVIFWDKPVNASGLLFFGPFEALAFLKSHLTERTDLHYRLALSMMSSALEGRTSPDEAREIFEAVLAETDDEGEDGLLLAG